MSRAMRNFVQPHKQTRGCRMGCGAQVPALINGVIVERPICEKCRAELAEQFKLARIQDGRRSHKRPA